jgi:hypothetical protein
VADFFGPVSRFLMEGAGGEELLVFSRGGPKALPESIRVMPAGGEPAPASGR